MTLLLAATLATSAKDVTAQRAPAGAMAGAREAGAITPANAEGVSARIVTCAATLQALIAPDRDGKRTDIAGRATFHRLFVPARAYAGRREADPDR